ncbi:hypothetical protein [Thioclava sp. A2]|uniref:hypothetical protein n=1 Tax=Thioclava sp. FCG-A2 TaxID=3080562 RepID=UPI0029542123|nr:hypothetical protein [Thioclava sp. A2]
MQQGVAPDHGDTCRVALRPLSGRSKWDVACHAVSDLPLIKYLPALIVRASDPLRVHAGLWRCTFCFTRGKTLASRIVLTGFSPV